MIFNKGGKTIRKKFFLGNTQLENVRSYKYLGFLFTSSGEIKTGLQDLRDRALKAFMKLRNSMGNEFNRKIQTTLQIFDCMVKPIILYSADFWGGLKAPATNPVYTLQHTVCRQLLGVQKYTSNIGSLLELGRIPLHIDGLAVQNWERIRKGQANPILLASYNETNELELPWITTIKSCLESSGMLNFFPKPPLR